MPEVEVPTLVKVLSLEPLVAEITVEVSIPDVVAIERELVVKIIGGLTTMFTR